MLAEQRFEEVAEAAFVAEIGKMKIRTLAEIRRRLEFFARSVATRAQLVVGLALGRVLEGFVGLVDGLEFFLGARLLAHVRMEFARELPVRGLDLRLGGFGFDAESVVVILELHVRWIPRSCAARTASFAVLWSRAHDHRKRNARGQPGWPRASCRLKSVVQ